MKLLEKLFGRWEIISKKEVVAVMAGLLGEYEREGLLVVEQNSKTNKKRAYVKFLNGIKKTIDPDFVAD